MVSMSRKLIQSNTVEIRSVFVGFVLKSFSMASGF